MKVKKYVAHSMPEAMKQIRKELGKDAVILHSREVKRGSRIFGLGKKTKIEVVAAKDSDPLIYNQTRQEGLTAEKRQAKEPKQESNSNVLEELQQVKKLLFQSSLQGIQYPVDFQVVYNQLLEQEVEVEIATSIMEAVIEREKTAKIHHSSSELAEEVNKEIERRLQSTHFEGISEQSQIIYFVGPTGVGKTTTLAKIAATSKLQEHKSIAFITTDTYRIAAVEQLKTYAQLLNVPLEVAYSNEELQKAIMKFAAYDLIFVDTAGRNFRNDQDVINFQEGLPTNEASEVFLVLSLSAKPKDILDIYDQFRSIAIKAVIATKMDETRQYGSLLNITLGRKIGIAYITNGQNVPDDITRPDAKMISNFILGEHNEI
ncbi:hypothetical protein M948_15320 [Virgibacillus sp. CM-4]|nr:flagellar biosynthesis protein FlhF [Virgibacillus massiliensis]EQB36399.1 hypothetical protein M948_15320 [Virgibacillus sp. CM-4]